jgi:hypothetical protein
VFTQGGPSRVSSPLVGEDQGGGSRRPWGQASGAFDNLAGPRDPPPRPAPTREGGCANAIDSTETEHALTRFGDMLSDVAAMLTGSLGDADPKTGKRRALYEPVHGSAPDIAGKGLANPIAMIGSFGMALRYSFGLDEAANRLEAAIAEVLGPRASAPPTSRAKARASCPRAKWETRSSPNWGARTPKASPTKKTEHHHKQDCGRWGTAGADRSHSWLCGP